MTAAEFKMLWRYFVKSFNSVEQWLVKNFPVESTNDRQTSQGEILFGWRRVLEDVTLDDAKAAVDVMARGDEDAPRGPEEYFRTIRRIAKRIAAERGTPAGQVRATADTLGSSSSESCLVRITVQDGDQGFIGSQDLRCQARRGAAETCELLESLISHVGDFLNPSETIPRARPLGTERDVA